ncbi:YczE/YyaS/YitT family protein [Isachenkonia alkalipeptolytica]|uniref:YitT family protein n=1 Tax=Isachenkonia alkalipeptolytica TaxID=2565777 RepID=A0AA44BEV2_9CLOT|nr:DUF6198 family protein [Isachenkonia alkalipeptolytica]NBG89382.1 hypothetical protein [Isachenkonia alkalipeptolytica]
MIKAAESDTKKEFPIKTKKKVSAEVWARRLLIYISGLFLLAMGVAFSIKSGLGVSPVSSFPYALSLVFNMDVGLLSTIVFSFYVVLQIVLLRRNFQLKNLFQLAIASLFGFFVSLSNTIIAPLSPVGYFSQLALLGISLVLIAIGIIFYLAANVIPQPPEGLVLALQKVTKVPFSKVKVMFDVTSVSLAGLLLIFFHGNVVGLREGTVIAALGVGKLIGIFSKWIKPPVLRFCKNDIVEKE